MDDRLYVALLVDAAGTIVQRLSRTVSGPGGVDYVFVGPAGGEVPAGARRIDVAGNDVWMLMRVATDGTRADEAEALRLQRGFRIAPLADRAALDRPQAGPDVAGQPIVKASEPMGSLAFFHVLAAMLERNPVPVTDRGLVRRWERIGLAPGRFDEAALTAPMRAGIERGIKDAEQAIVAAQFGLAISVNGWNYSLKVGKTGTDPDWALNAAIARGGYGNRPEDSVYYQRNLDAAGLQLSGANRYTMTFKAGELPPVGAFWSITAYQMENFDLIENVAKRYSLGDRTPGLKPNPDGSLTIALQNDPPTDPVLRANWLPVGDRSYYLIIRTYDPKPPIMDGSWAPPDLVRIDAGGRKDRPD
jgi:hypothetical protein